MYSFSYGSFRRFFAAGAEVGIAGPKSSSEEEASSDKSVSVIQPRLRG